MKLKTKRFSRICRKTKKKEELKEDEREKEKWRSKKKGKMRRKMQKKMGNTSRWGRRMVTRGYAGGRVYRQSCCSRCGISLMKN